MPVLNDLKMYARFAMGLRDFLRHPISRSEAEEIVRQRFADREKNFMRLVERGIFGYAKSPYLPLLKLAHYELGDIQNMVSDRGLESTLVALREAGVYIGYEEFKGRKPIVRGGQVIPVQPHDFDNPYLKHYYQAETSGSTGAGTRVDTDLDFIADQTPQMLLSVSAHDISDGPMVMWRGILPDHSSIHSALMALGYGRVTRKWFAFITADNLKPPLRFRLATWNIVALSRLFGVPFPFPERVRLDQAHIVARWVANVLKTEHKCLVSTMVSNAMRVSIAAAEEGLDLTGAAFYGGGEPPTPAKVRQITQTGARWIPGYFIAEAGTIGLGCAHPIDGNDVHFLKDTLALVQYPRQLPGTSAKIDAFYYTSLLGSAPKLLLNVESDDFGILEKRSCGCLMENLGYTEHIRQIRSFSKLTGEGVTLVGSEMVYILEEVLPARFGGNSLDYQLMEEEDEQGFTRLNLVISPKIQISDEQQVIEAVFEALRSSSLAADTAREVWKQANTLRVKRMQPVSTEQGKTHSFRVAQRDTQSNIVKTDSTLER